MNFMVDGHKVTMLKGTKVSVIEVHREGHGDAVSFVLRAPEEFIHPVLRATYKDKLRTMLKTSSYRQSIANVSRHISSKRREHHWSTLKIKSEFESENGSLDEAKDNWDYNRAPKNAVKEGKHGDLKAFLTQRIGRDLKL